MRIAIVLDYSLDLIGGAQRAALNEAAALVAAGHGVVLVAPRPTDPRSVLPLGVDALWTSARRLPALDFPLVPDGEELRGRLVRHLRAARIDAVHVHSEFGHARAALHAARVLGLPVVHTVHTAYWPGVPGPLRPVARDLLARLAGPVPHRTRNPLLDHTVDLALAADVVVSPSAHQAADLVRLGVPAPAVRPNCDAGGAPPLPLPSFEHLRVAWVGRCVPEKRLLAFVRAVRIARSRLPEDRLRVAVAGRGPLLPVAQRIAGPGVVFLGRLDRAGVRHLLDASHLTALTSHGFDNQPMTVVESVRAGRGVLHTDPRLREGLDRAGLLAAAPDTEAIADLLVELALDPTRVRAAAVGARASAALFAPEAHVARLLPLLAGGRAAAAA
ncbi:glycosyltransferase family 4 protein [Amnibacterium kyonggiense]|uniref:Glycosyltransferase involved in cell wall biosynthesis n=1 Tax=Amnibacterium kyonggiense TaxID=595671 RepID=A0A4R7FME8_9MICO|nr:glycosyltransferase family 4 protein [Amnibacterium kyonggiense]TDS77613.1 glycosyltransferase involved in cell wall biosynthesis [Amnibacterium kyonggiense]